MPFCQNNYCFWTFVYLILIINYCSIVCMYVCMCVKKKMHLYHKIFYNTSSPSLNSACITSRWKCVLCKQISLLLWLGPWPWANWTMSLVKMFPDYYFMNITFSYSPFIMHFIQKVRLSALTFRFEHNLINLHCHSDSNLNPYL